MKSIDRANGDCWLVVLWRKTKIGGIGFTIYLRDQDGIISQEPLAEQGLFRGHALDFYYNDMLTLLKTRLIRRMSLPFPSRL